MISRTQNEIMKNWPAEWNSPVVSIRCITYNHEPYIAEALDGFLMQETDFPFEIVVHDDASTDNTANIIREYEAKYPKIIKPIYETENQYSKHDGSLRKIMNAACKGKYTAYCEGDDFWIFPKKLQTQIEFLEKNKKYTMTYSSFSTVNEYGNIIERPSYEKKIKDSQSGFLFSKLINHNFIMTLTICIRKEILESPIYIEAPYHIDYTIFLTAALLGKIKFFPQKMGAYRQSPTGLMATQGNKINFIIKQTKVYFTQNYFFSKPNKFPFVERLSILYQTALNILTDRQNKETYIRILKRNKKILFFMPFAFIHKIVQKISMLFFHK